MDCPSLSSLIGFSSFDTIYINFSGLKNLGDLSDIKDPEDFKKATELQAATVIIHVFAEFVSRIVCVSNWCACF